MVISFRNNLLLFLSLLLSIGVFYFTRTNDDVPSVVVVEEVEWETDNRIFVLATLLTIVVDKDLYFFLLESILKFLKEVIYFNPFQDVETPPPKKGLI